MVRPARLPVVIRLLDERYGRRQWQPRLGPLDELVFTILTQNTTDRNAERTLAKLKESFPDWQAVIDAPLDAIADAIRGGGLADIKSRYIREVLAGILEEQGALDMSFLDKMSDREAIGYLTRFRGVGVKTASCVLLFAMSRPVMPVDTHVYRVMKRLGFIDDSVSRDAAHGILTAVIPPKDIYSFHVNLVTHGRQVCRARNPLCRECVITALCPVEVLD